MCVHIVYSQHVGMTDGGVMRASQGGPHIVRSARWQVGHTHAHCDSSTGVSDICDERSAHSNQYFYCHGSNPEKFISACVGWRP